MAGGGSRRPSLERTVPLVDTSQAAPDRHLEDACKVLSTAIATEADPAVAATRLEEERLRVLAEAEKLSTAKRQLEMETRELRAVYHHPRPEQLSDLWRLGDNVGRELFGDHRDAAPPATEKGVYSTPAENMKVVGVALEELSHLEGEAFARQRQRCKQLVRAANEQQRELDPNGSLSLMVSDPNEQASSLPNRPRLEKAGAAKGGRADDGAQSANTGGNRRARRAASQAARLDLSALKAPASE